MDAEQNLMTAGEFNTKVKAWASKVRNTSRGVLTKTHSGGSLSRKLQISVRFDKEKIWLERVGFRFLRYGAFREYGAGRGYIVQNGVIVRGYSEFRFKKNRQIWKEKGYDDNKIKAIKHTTSGGLDIRRSPLSWLDTPIRKNINELGDIAGEYFGDDSLQHVLEQLNKITIKKSYGK